MSKNKASSWTTKYGVCRVRQEAPTLEEAITAAQGLTDDLESQADIAASLIGQPREKVRAELLKLAPPRKDVTRTFALTGLAAAPRMVVVERKTSRRGASQTDRAGRPALRSSAEVSMRGRPAFRQS